MSGPVQTALRELEEILDRLSDPGPLEAADLEVLARSWDETTARLDQLVEAEPTADSRQCDLDRARLKRLIQRLPDVQRSLATHKSEVARQLFSENRRFKNMRSGYGSIAAGYATRKFNRQV